ncbi:MAG: amidohydrolase family protein [candidate division NC10 bacterium]|nr:amidohydrolase family protein [candidate division NC10 bacterium]
MRTELGEMRVIDAHAHFFSYPFFMQFVEALRQGLPRDDPYRGVAERLGWELPTPDHTALGRRWIQEMDKHGLDRMVLIASLPGDEDSILAAVRTFPQRIIGYFMLDPTRADAAERTKKALADGLRGVCLFPAMHHFHVWEERCYPVYEAAQEARAIVFTHFGILKIGVRDKLGLPSRFDMRFSNPIDLHRVAKDFPKTTFVMPHFGCGFLREALIVGDQCPNVCVDTSSSNAWVNTMPTPLTLTDLFRAALRVFGPERILFGTDSTFLPRGWRRDIFDAQVQALKALEVTTQQARLIFGGNLARLLQV